MSVGYVFDADPYMRLDQLTWYNSCFIRNIDCDDVLCLTDIRSSQDYFGGYPTNKTHITYKSESPEQYLDLFHISKKTETAERRRLMINMRMDRVEKIPHMRPQVIDWNVQQMTYVSLGGCNRKMSVSFNKNTLFRK